MKEMRSYLLALALSIGLLFPFDGAFSQPQPSQYGSYEGTVKTEWLGAEGEYRKMKLLESFAYVDPSGARWDAPKGSIVDGASIPRIGWTVVGGPLEGPYRDASVIHDVACDRRERPWEYVHLAFYYAMLRTGVSSVQAKVMYPAVYFFGPRWEYRVPVVGNVKAAEKTAENLRSDPQLRRGSKVQIGETKVEYQSTCKMNSSGDIVCSGIHPSPPACVLGSRLRESVDNPLGTLRGLAVSDVQQPGFDASRPLSGP
jgi:hypothetical protein